MGDAVLLETGTAETCMAKTMEYIWSEKVISLDEEDKVSVEGYSYESSTVHKHTYPVWSEMEFGDKSQCFLLIEFTEVSCVKPSHSL